MATEQFIDGVTTHPQPEDKMTAASGTKTTVLIAFLTPYLLYILWCVFLLSVLPNVSGQYEFLIPLGTFGSIIGGILLLGIVALLMMRVLDAKTIPMVKSVAILKIASVLIPGILLSALVPFLISREPTLAIEILDPKDQAKLTAPLTVTYSLEQAQQILLRRGLKIEKVIWDFDGDGKPNEETIDPKITAVYDKKGVYTVVAVIQLQDKTQRKIATRLVIPDAVFSVFPFRPIVNEPVTFSVAHLLTDPVALKEVQWDFQSDGEIDETTDQKEVTFTFFRPGAVVISAVIVLTNQTQVTMKKEIFVSEPPPLPFPVNIQTDPENLVSPAPFGVLFTIDTKEPVQKVVWNLGDGSIESGERVGHTFNQNGNYYVTAEVYSLSGAVARVNKTVRVVDVLRLPDLQFSGSHQVVNRKISGEVPLTVDLMPKTAEPLVDFRWEVPNASSVESASPGLKATFRKPGSYTATLVATGPSENVLRYPITIEVLPQSSTVSFRMDPEGGVAPLKVRFDASETVIPNEEITGFEWKFGMDAQAAIQGGAQIEYLYEQPGTYKVAVSAFTTSGKVYSTEKTIVVRAPVLDACFTTSRTSGKAPLGVSFDMSCTTGVPATIQWDFGDGSFADERNPIHVFESPGTYSVVLRLQDEQGSSSQEVLSIIANP